MQAVHRWLASQAPLLRGICIEGWLSAVTRWWGMGAIPVFLRRFENAAFLGMYKRQDLAARLGIYPTTEESHTS